MRLGGSVAGRRASSGFVIAGAIVGFGQPVGIALTAVGLRLLVLERTLKHLPRRPAH
jgi:hypothetical protein